MTEKYPDVPGSKGHHGTSEAAAEAMTPKAPNLREQCLDVLKRAYPVSMTADEVADALDRSPFSVRPRITELFAKGLIFDTGARRPNHSGSKAVCWAAVQDG